MGGPILAAVLRLAVPIVLAAVVLTFPARGRACATCGAGDPTLTVMGEGQPFEGRLRSSVRLRYRWDRVSADATDDVTLHEGRLDLGLSYAPNDRLVLSATVPVVLRDVSWQSGAHYRTLGPGDIELRSRLVLLRDRPVAPSHLLGPTLGVKLPTSIDQVDGDGKRLPVDAQTGTGTVDPLLGLFYAHFADPWSFFTSATVGLPLAGRFEEAPGPSLRGTTALQYRFDQRITVRGGVDVRLDAPARVGEQTDPRSDHFALFLSPNLLWSPANDWLVLLGLRVPMLQISEQGREEGWYFLTSVAVDL